ncbi:MAG: transketolase C-terminal domain-containing protein [Spirochaetales bacterium]|uniref:Transketolase C-terminal domain-containing protein n=1 Tax=Candidatus Thalassospirochaeta sargassi TaxID=3119039 RepID=A0AAJ1ICH1_9SPIO|nr:transketolase C-terminal domain-containing protein [Spirochaetales bacterium]
MGMRETYTESLIRLAEKDERICLLDADLRVGHGTKPFYDRFPDRAINCGVAEANMLGIAAGLAAGGKIPFAETFGCFAARRAFDQFFISGNYAGLNVKLLGSDPGVTAAFNGGTHMPFEDLALMRAIPGLTIVSPCDPYSLGELMEPLAYSDGCVYLRMPRKAEQQIYMGNEKIELGRGKVLKEGSDITIAATGFVMVPEALKAAELLDKDGISAAVIDFHTIKPLDTDLIEEWAGKTTMIVTMENHQKSGGFGGAVAEHLSSTKPVPVFRIGIEDRFGQVGTEAFLKQDYGLTAEQSAPLIRDFFYKLK